MSDKCNADNQEQFQVENKGDSSTLDADAADTSCRQGPEAPQNEPSCSSQNEETQTKTVYSQAESAVTETSSKDDPLDKTFRSWNTTGLPDVSPPKTTPSFPSMPQSDISEVNSWPQPPKTLVSAPLKTRKGVIDSSQVRGVRTSAASQRTRLLVFIKIILKCLDYEDPSLHLAAKQIITECTRKNREGIPGYDPLANAITTQLRIAVGELHWNRAERLMSHYLQSRSGKSPGNAVKIDKPQCTAV